MKNRMKVIVILLVIIIIILTITLLILLFARENITEEPVLESSTMAIKEESNVYVDEIIERYMQCYNDGAIEELKAITDGKNYDIFGKLNETISYYVNEIYSFDNFAGVIYFVQLKSIDDEDVYVVINADYTNYTFKIIKSTQKEYEDMKNGVIKDEYKQYVQVEKNNYNVFSLKH